jgi:hypothetical protein
VFFSIIITVPAVNGALNSYRNVTSLSSCLRLFTEFVAGGSANLEVPSHSVAPDLLMAVKYIYKKTLV